MLSEATSGHYSPIDSLLNNAPIADGDTIQHPTGYGYIADAFQKLDMYSANVMHDMLDKKDVDK